VVAVALDGEPPLASLAARCGLTRAESEVLALIARGVSNSEIARRQFVSIETAKTHVQRVLGRLGVRSRVQAALLARED
jgi:DNA-binding CsgD family transcriptional regulator